MASRDLPRTPPPPSPEPPFLSIPPVASLSTASPQPLAPLAPLPPIYSCTAAGLARVSAPPPSLPAGVRPLAPFRAMPHRFSHPSPYRIPSALHPRVPHSRGAPSLIRVAAFLLACPACTVSSISTYKMPRLPKRPLNLVLDAAGELRHRSTPHHFQIAGVKSC